MTEKNNKSVTIPRRIAQTLLNALKGGVVPRVGLPYITVGRRKEMEALLHDAEIVSEGGASFRMIVGKYGSGKSFLLQTLRNYAMDRNFVVVDADLSPERRLHGNNGQGLATYREMIKNLSVKTRPESGALSMLLDKWIDSLQTETAETANISPEDPIFTQKVEQKIFAVIHAMQELVHGFDFAKLLTMYYRAFIEGDDDLKAKVLKWFRGEYNTKTEARQELGVNVIITDDDWYDYLKLFAFFFRQAGYKGMMVFVDELVNIYKIPNSIARQYNYEKILSIYNDALQGKAQYVGIIMSGTPQCVEDIRRGMYSYEALRSRLQDGKFAQQGLQDMRAPVLRLQPLTSEEMMVLTEKIANIHSSLYNYECKLTDVDLLDFIKIEFGRIGAASNITPREVIRDFIELLDILYQNPDTDIKTLLGSEAFDYAKPELENKDIDPLFAKFTL
ncbi:MULTISPECIES: ATP-binding protein [Sphingobacterium]|uniref:ATP-binding protein n=1 Tax=Sphingobacterium TaxID=28453 RepID=UPI001556E2D6|nr:MULTISPECIES: ATP-binding protein [Sphingobacterium]NPE44946.1 ATP-binding protein [Sphingobacterium prati]